MEGMYGEDHNGKSGYGGLLGNIDDQIKGRTLFQIFPDIDSKIVQALIENKRENYTLFLQVGKNPVFAVLAPVMIEGEPGTEIALMAQAIHNSSPRSHGPFGMICCRGQNDEQQENTIFNASGILASVAGGTLLIEGIEEMTRQNQQKLIELIQYKRCASMAVGV